MNTSQADQRVCLCRTSCCREVWEKGAAVYFDFALRSLPHSRSHLFSVPKVFKLSTRIRVCVYVYPTLDVSASPCAQICVCVCVQVNPEHLKRDKSCLSQSDGVSCMLCLCSGCVRHREIKKKSEGASYAFSCPPREHQMRWWNF